MSSHPHFPIISTTPPPLDINDDNSEDEEEDDFGSFNHVMPENEIEFNDFKINNVEDIDFNNKDNDCIVRNESFDTKIDDKSFDEEIKSHNCINNKNDCDNHINVDLKPNNENVDKISIKSIEFPDPEIDSSLSVDEPNLQNSINYEENDEKLKSDGIEANDLQNSLTNTPSNDSEVDDIEVQEPTDDIQDYETDKLEDNAKQDNDFEDDCDFADFTSFRFTESEQIVTAFQSEKQTEEQQSESLNNAKSETSFGDFNSSNFNAFNNIQSNGNDLNNEESDDDFADFASAEPVVQQIETSFHSNKSSSDIPPNDGEFADFASFNNDNELEFEHKIKQESSIELSADNNKLSELFADIFPCSETVTPDENSMSIPRDLFHNAEQNSKSLWKSVQNLEDAPSLKLRWPNSHSFQLLLAALRIDPRNILRNSSVPMFASGLGHVLEPTKHTLNSDSNNENTIDHNESGIESTNNTLSSIPPSIPPVQFDWSSSGLTNPLDINQKSSVSFDLDFFVTNDDVNNITNKQIGISSFEEELLSNQIQTNSKIDSISGDLDSISDRTDIVQQLLSSVKSTSTSTNPISDRNQVLSAEALQVLDELPNLSFMRAKVLMFPINIKTDSNRS